jgi:hypothetical protein
MAPEFVGSDLSTLARTGLTRYHTTTGSE